MAKNLRELLLLRDHNRQYIDSVTDNLGSALGLKNGDGEPCIIVFVPRKIKKKWLPNSKVIRDRLEAPNGLRCPVDVVEGSKYEPYNDVNLIDVTDADAVGSASLVTRRELLGPPPLSSCGRVTLLELLRGWTETVTPGAQVCHPGGGYGKLGGYGTLGCFARDPSGKLGFITNKHVAGQQGDVLYFPSKDGIEVGRVKRVFDHIADEARFPGIVDEPEASYKIDCAFAELPSGFPPSDIEPRLPIVNDKDKVVLAELGEPLGLDLDTLGPLGASVIAVGRTRSFQRGHISAFAYSWDVNLWAVPVEKQYTDFLIVGETGEEFSDGGDSGKLIVTDDGQYRPIALLWGGWREKLRHGRMQEKWTYAIDINKILEKLEVSIISTLEPQNQYNAGLTEPVGNGSARNAT